MQTITPEEKEQRELTVKYGRVLAKAKGIPFSEQAEAIMKRFVDGELEFAEMKKLLLQQVDSEIDANGGPREIADRIGDAPCQGI